MPLDFDQADAQIIAQKLTRHTEIPWPRQTSTPSPQQQSHPMRQGRRQRRVRNSSPIPCAKADGNAESAVAVPSHAPRQTAMPSPQQQSQTASFYYGLYACRDSAAIKKILTLKSDEAKPSFPYAEK